MTSQMVTVLVRHRPVPFPHPILLNSYFPSGVQRWTSPNETQLRLGATNLHQNHLENWLKYRFLISLSDPNTGIPGGKSQKPHFNKQTGRGWPSWASSAVTQVWGVILCAGISAQQAHLRAWLEHTELDISMRHQSMTLSSPWPRWFWLRGEVRTGEKNLELWVQMAQRKQR